MKRDNNEINRIVELTTEYLNRGDLSSALETYGTLKDLYPKVKGYYNEYMNLLLDPEIVSELGWSCYEKAIVCSETAIGNVAEGDKLPFYKKKAYIYLVMIEENDEWFTTNRKKVLDFYESALKLYPSNPTLLKCAMRFYSLSGNFEQYYEVVDRLIRVSPEDQMIIMKKLAGLEIIERAENSPSQKNSAVKVKWRGLVQSILKFLHQK